MTNSHPEIDLYRHTLNLQLYLSLELSRCRRILVDVPESQVQTVGVTLETGQLSQHANQRGGVPRGPLQDVTGSEQMPK